MWTSRLPRFSIRSFHSDFALVRWNDCTPAQQNAALPSSQARYVVESAFWPTAFEDSTKRCTLVSMATEFNLVSGAGGLSEVPTDYLCSLVGRAVDNGHVLVIEKRYFLEEHLREEEQPPDETEQPADDQTKIRLVGHGHLSTNIKLVGHGHLSPAPTTFSQPLFKEPKPEPPPPAPLIVETHCKMVSLAAFCEHKGRRAQAGGALEVVTDKTIGSDLITVAHKVENGHGGDPVVKVNGDRISGSSFKAKGPMTHMAWIPTIHPAQFQVTAETCSGSACGLVVRAYPPDKLSVEIKQEKQFPALAIAEDALKTFLKIFIDRVDNVKLLRGNIGIEAYWKEHADHRAFYYFKIKGALDIFVIDIKVIIGPSKVSRLASKIPGIGKYIGDVIDWLIKAGIYLKVIGKLAFQTSMERTGPDQPKFFQDSGSGLEGEIKVDLGVELAALNDKVLKVDIYAEAGIKGNGMPHVFEEGFGLEGFGISFSGLEGIADVSLLWGWIRAKGKIVFFEKTPIYGPKRVVLSPHPPEPE